MPKWSKDATEFIVSTVESSGTVLGVIPKPIREMLGNPKKLKFRKIRGRVVVESGDE